MWLEKNVFFPILHPPTPRGSYATFKGEEEVDGEGGDGWGGGGGGRAGERDGVSKERTCQEEGLTCRCSSSGGPLVFRSLLTSLSLHPRSTSRGPARCWEKLKFTDQTKTEKIQFCFPDKILSWLGWMETKLVLGSSCSFIFHIWKTWSKRRMCLKLNRQFYSWKQGLSKQVLNLHVNEIWWIVDGELQVILSDPMNNIQPNSCQLIFWL